MLRKITEVWYVAADTTEREREGELREFSLKFDSKNILLV